MTSPATPPDLTMVVPTYNERERISELVTAVFAAADRASIVLEMVIVDDGSPDGTGALADSLTATHRLVVVHRAGKLGLGSAVVEGFRVASGAVIGVMDADLSHPPSVVPGLLAAFRATQADLLVASRYIPGGSTKDWPLRRRLMSLAACVAARPLSPIRDATSGFFLIRREVSRAAVVKAAGFKICLELLIRAWPIRLVEFPYQFDDRQQGKSKMTTREGARYLLQLRDLYVARFTRGRRPERSYRQVSGAEARMFMAQPAPAEPQR
jgi:dolichol-phosphate mannosyltransferase